mmetsp:Transcript_46025/g.87822  ORF Transcript_46025/g.87822 Transcript_46025/m.87822 type:complete len:244 (+) Transcript_46025:1086-1817(+)
MWQQLVQRRSPSFLIMSHDHLAHEKQALRGGEEHVLGAAEPNASGSVAAGEDGVGGGVRVGECAHLARFVRPAQHRLQMARDGGRAHLHLALNHLSREPVDAHPRSLLKRRAAHARLLARRVNLQLRGPAHARLSPPASHHRRVAGGAASRRHHSLRRPHPPHVLGAGLVAQQKHLLPRVVPSLRCLGCENNLSHRCAWAGGQSLGQDARLVALVVGEAGMQQLLQVAGVHRAHGAFLARQPL